MVLRTKEDHLRENSSDNDDDNDVDDDYDLARFIRKFKNIKIE